MASTRCAERDPGDIGGEQAKRCPGAVTELVERQGADRETEQNAPPDRNAELVAEDRIVAAAFEAEVDDKEETEEPDGNRLKVDSLEQAADIAAGVVPALASIDC